MLDVRSLHVAYGSHEALSGVDLTVSVGEIVAVVGPSGCGKSTLLRAIAGLEAPSSGSVMWGGCDLSGVPTHRRGFGLMFQDYALFPHRDVAANVAFGARMQGSTKRHAAAAAVRALDLVGLGGYGHRRVDQLSGGEQQRVALARVLCAEPKLVLLDEPLGSLDRALRDGLLQELRRILASRTAVYVTHDQEEAFSIADRLVVLRDGRVAQEGTPERVWRSPRSEWVARFLGHRNVVAGEVRAGLLSLPWGCVAAPASAADGPVAVVVHQDAARPDPEGDVVGVVVAREFLGSHHVVHVRTDAGPELDMAVTWRPEPAVGDLVRLDVDPAGLSVLCESPP